MLVKFDVGRYFVKSNQQIVPFGRWFWWWSCFGWTRAWNSRARWNWRMERRRAARHLFWVFRGWNITQLCGKYLINRCKEIQGSLLCNQEGLRGWVEGSYWRETCFRLVNLDRSIKGMIEYGPIYSQNDTVWCVSQKEIEIHIQLSKKTHKNYYRCLLLFSHPLKQK